ncbi:hypothetical protein [Paenibacillus spongiae]|uniref:DUF4064 domain-containing protein n=1 Tax=Paenibacillus spongiae TaxID=2909671 RepID=A0ABY5SD05_9BACL|nr:hypothetical protein [Paenibacillus spongiae]UVI31836.1 hypothetical protein L1F29_08485 [Paenibacillus spongiae]
MNEYENNTHNHPDGFRPIPEPAMTEQPKKISGLGIASFIIGLVSIITFIVCMVVVTSSIMDYITEDGKPVIDAEAVSANVSLILSGLFLLGSLGLSFIGLVLGIVGACMKDRRKAFAIVGIVLNGLLVVGTGGLFLLGIFQSAI